MKTIAKLTNRRDDHGVHEGYLLLADIAGYTAFLTGTELVPSAARIPGRPDVCRPDRRQLDGVSGFDHRAVADNHRDMAVPHRQIARPQ